MKVVVLEDLAAHFKLKTQNVIDRIQDLQAEGLLTGMFTSQPALIHVFPSSLLHFMDDIPRFKGISLQIEIQYSGTRW
jgi:hypothetical protein